MEAGPGVHLRDRPRPSEDARLVVTTLAGEPFVEKPPGIYVVAGAFVELLNGLLPAHDAARLATGSFVALALVFLALTAREIFGRGFASAAVLIPLGCLGTLPRMHQLIPDVVLLAGVAVGMYGLALARKSLWAAGAALGLGGASAFFGKGLFGPGVLALTALLLPLFAAWRTRRYAAALGVAAVVGALPPAFWMHALFARSPALALVARARDRNSRMVAVEAARTPARFRACGAVAATRSSTRRHAERRVGARERPLVGRTCPRAMGVRHHALLGPRDDAMVAVSRFRHELSRDVPVLARALPEGDCVASLYFGEGQRGLFVYFENVTTVRLERVPDAACMTLLVQRTRATGATGPSEEWVRVWEGARPGDRKELYRLYRKDVAAGHPVARFPE